MNMILIKVCTVFLLTWLALPSHTLVQKNVMIGLKYTNYTNYNGTVADGTCCDNPGLRAPSCPPIQCDTSFLPCATYVGGLKCKAYFESGTPVMFDNNSFTLGDQIGNNQTSSTLLVFQRAYAPGDINVSILAREESRLWGKTLIANFSFVIDWMETFYNRPPRWRQLILYDTHAELGVDVFYQCQKHFYGPTCSTRCDNTNTYTCLNDGSKNCTEGWRGLDCDELVPYCASNACQNGGTCVNVHLGYTCTCMQGYKGQDCEHDLRRPSTVTTKTTTASTAATTSSAAYAITTTTATMSTGQSTYPSSPLTTGATTRNPTKLSTSSRSNVTRPAAQQPGMKLKNNSRNSTREMHTTKTNPSTSSGDSTAIVATSVPVGLCLLGLVTSTSAYFYRKMKRSSGGEKVAPEPPSSRDTIIDDPERNRCSTSGESGSGQPGTATEAWGSLSSPTTA